MSITSLQRIMLVLSAVVVFIAYHLHIYKGETILVLAAGQGYLLQM